MAHDVFISHASQDKVIADAVVTALETEKIRCWIAPRDIRSGEHWAAAINNAIKSSKIMILIFSESSNQSDQVINELTLAVKSKVTVIPFKIEDAMPQGVMEYYLAATHWLDAMNPPTEKQIAKLVETVQNSLGIKVEDEATPITPEKVAPVIPEKPLKQEEDKFAINKKTGLMVAAIVASLLLLFGGYKLLTPVSEDQTISPDNSEKITSADSEKTQAVSTVPVGIANEGEIVVTSTDDDGEGTLRWALHMAVQGDVITFDPAVFPPDDPQTIYIKKSLPPINRGNLIINASNAGVIIDGGQGRSPDYFAGFTINSSNNLIMGLQIINFRGYHPEYNDYDAGSAILITGSMSRNNTIGGDRSVGAGPLGQGNLMAGNSIGVDLQNGAAQNIIVGNLIGTDLSGERQNEVYGNTTGLVIDHSANHNTIGPDNIIAYNMSAINVGQHYQTDLGTVGNTITANSIFDNSSGTQLNNGGNKELRPPNIISINLTGGTVRGTTSPAAMVEIFSDSSNQGKIFEGRVKADENGNFSFEAGRRITGPNITATATDEDGNTSEFSASLSN